jgi:hypothetical protein
MISEMVTPEVDPLRKSEISIQPADTSPQVSPVLTPPESKEVHAASMTDQELAAYVQSKLRPVGSALLGNIPYLREARQRFAQPGRRVPVPGHPTFGQWIRRNLGISDRHVRRLLAPPEDSARKLRKKQRRDETLDMAVTMAHAVLGLREADSEDPSGHRRQAALTNMAFQLLRRVRHKPIAMHVTVETLQSGQVEELYRKMRECLGEQIDQVFGSLDEEQRVNALGLFSEKIAGNYVRRDPAVVGADPALLPDAIRADDNTDQTCETGSHIGAVGRLSFCLH